MGIIISADTEYPEYVVRLIDDQYSEDIYNMLNGFPCLFDSRFISFRAEKCTFFAAGSADSASEGLDDAKMI